jgi:hypothetical protein
MDSQIVQNRTCGPCHVCCRVHAILDPALKKSPGVLCSHLKPGAGCSIYRDRPETCRSYYCAWRQLPQFDESWRPDLSNVYVELKSDPPEHYRHLFPEAPLAFKFTLLGDLEAKRLGLLATTTAELIAHDVPVILAVTAPPEHLGCCLLLNPLLKPFAAEAGPPFIEGFAWALHTLYNAKPEKIDWTKYGDSDHVSRREMQPYTELSNSQ